MDTVELYTAVQYVPACSVAVPPAETLKTRRRRRRSIRSIYPVIGIEVNRTDQRREAGSDGGLSSRRSSHSVPFTITVCTYYMYLLPSHHRQTHHRVTESQTQQTWKSHVNSCCRCPQLHHNGRMVILPSRHAPATRYKHGPACTGRPCLYLALNEG